MNNVYINNDESWIKAQNEGNRTIALGPIAHDKLGKYTVRANKRTHKQLPFFNRRIFIFYY